jgi:hypothetical protein
MGRGETITPSQFREMIEKVVSEISIHDPPSPNTMERTENSARFKRLVTQRNR